MRWVLSCAVVLALSSPAAQSVAWSLDRSLILEVLRRAQPDLRECIRRHALAEGRYLVWLEVGASGRATATFRSVPEQNPTGTRCLARAFQAQRFPSPWEATVAFSGASPPGRKYSVAYPFVVARSRLELIGVDLPPWRPSPARASLPP